MYGHAVSHLPIPQVHDKMHLRVNGVTAPDKPPEMFRPELPFEELRLVT